MNPFRRITALALIATLCVLATATSAFALPPSNDARSDATEISSLPYATSQDTAEATTDAADPMACSTDQQRTVWFSYTADTDERLVASTRGSSYSTLINVLEESGASLTPVSCGGAMTDFPVVAGRTYLIGIGAPSYYYNPPANWTLKFDLHVQPDVDVDFHQAAFEDINAQAVTVTGVAECSKPVTVRLPISLRQTTAEGTAAGSITSYLDCTRDAQLFSVRVPTYTSVDIKRGKAQLSADAEVPGEGVDEDVSRSVAVTPCTLIGTVGPDTMRGTRGEDRICSLHGKDAISAGKGYDVVYGGPGSDGIELGDGGGHAYGDTGDDTITGGSDGSRSGGGVDLVRGGGGDDVIRVGDGRDRAYGEAGRDSISGGAGNDRVFGGSGRDRLAGDTGTDECVGGPDTDTFSHCETKKQ